MGAPVHRVPLPPPAFEVRERGPDEMLAYVAATLDAAAAERDPAANHRILQGLTNAINQELRAARLRQAYDTLDDWVQAVPDRLITTNLDRAPGRAWQADVLLEAGAARRRATRVAHTRVAALESALTAAAATLVECWWAAQ
jgi:hypothetical protein